VSGALREKRRVVLASLVQTFHHYNTISNKLANSLQAAKDAGTLTFFDGMNYVSNLLFPSHTTTDDGCSATEGSVKTRANVLDMWTDELLKHVMTAREGDNSVVVVIDDVSVLLSMGFGLGPLCLAMDKLLNNLGLTGRSQSDFQGVSVVVSCAYCDGDKDSVALWSFLASRSSISVDLRGLTTGYCKDVHGQVDSSTCFLSNNFVCMKGNIAMPLFSFDYTLCMIVLPPHLIKFFSNKEMLTGGTMQFIHFFPFDLVAGPFAVERWNGWTKTQQEKDSAV
jgi:hypothetical protein